MTSASTKDCPQDPHLALATQEAYIQAPTPTLMCTLNLQHSNLNRKYSSTYVTYTTLQLSSPSHPKRTPPIPRETNICLWPLHSARQRPKEKQILSELVTAWSQRNNEVKRVIKISTWPNTKSRRPILLSTRQIWQKQTHPLGKLSLQYNLSHPRHPTHQGSPIF